MPPTIGDTLGRYRLVECLGRGGTGVVWKAQDPNLGRTVALKVLAPEHCCDREHLERFEREARALAAINHPGIVTIHSIEEAAGERFLTMEYVRGRRLTDDLPAAGLDAAEFFRIAVPLADAVAAAHRRGIVHRDLKPGNVMITEDGQVKVLDFGLAISNPREVAPLTDDDPTAPLSAAGGLSGTVRYMAPEQLEGRPADPRSDVFALGIMLHEIATARYPFRGATAPEWIAAVLRDRPIPIGDARPDLPRHLGRVLERCLERDPARRPTSAAEVRDELTVLSRDLRSGGVRGASSIAVLPFDDMSPGHDHDWLCEGIAEEILNALTRIDGLRVAARTSSFQFRDRRFDSREIGDRLGVEALLEGSVRRAGDRLRISARLVSAADGYRLWSERFDRDMADVFAVQDEIAEAVVRALELKLSPRERRAMRQVATDVVPAYEDYLRARTLFARYDRNGVALARTLFRRAIDRDASYAAAWAGLADCCTYLYQNVEHDDGLLREGDEASRTALDLDPDVPEAHVARGQVLTIQGRYEDARRHFESALRLAPRSFDAHYYYARSAFSAGRLDEAARLFEEAARLCRTDYQSLLLVAQVYDDQDRVDDAAAARRRGIRVVETRLEVDPDDVRALYMAANGLVALGETERGLALARRAKDLAPEDTMALYNLACIDALAGEYDDALDGLERAADLGFSNLAWLDHDSNLHPLRGLDRFRDLRARLGG